MATEVVHTIKTSGGNYSSLSAWESAQQRDLVTDDEIAVAECYSGEFTDQVLFVGWTTDVDRFIHVRNAAGNEHGGLSTAGFRMSGTSDHVIQTDNDAKVEGIVVLVPQNKQGFKQRAAADNFWVIGNVIKSLSTSTNGYGITFHNANDKTGYAVNNIVYDFTHTTGFAVGIRAGDYIYNNTVHNCRYGFQGDGVATIKNNIAQDSAVSDYWSSYADSATNLSSDATSPQTSLRNISLTFEDEAGDDFHLASGDTDAQGAGTDLSADANFAFSDDIDGDARPAGDWDIGADQFVAPPAGGVPSGLGLLGVGV